MANFEDVPLKIPSIRLYDIYRSAFRDYVLGEVWKTMKTIMKEVNEADEKILRVRKIMQEQRVGTPGKGQLWERKS